MSTDGHVNDEPRTLADTALHKLRSAIISGDLEPGSPLRLRELIDRLEMSSVPIREALRYLEHSGLVERRPHRGALVAEISVQDLQESYAIRMELEDMAVRLAAERVTPELAAHVQGLMDDYTEAFEQGDPKARDLHRQLHMALYAGSGSKWLMRLIPMLWDNAERYQRLSLPARDRATTLEEHRLIVQAAASGDPEEAADALRRHLEGTIDAALSKLQEQEDSAAEAEARPSRGVRS